MAYTQRLSIPPDLQREVLLAGDDIDGRYVLKAKLGEGGMGIVFQASQRSTNRDVALKVLKVDRVDESSVERFRQEIDIISGLSHPNIVRVYDTGRVGNRDILYVVMELVHGISLGELLWHKHAEEEFYKCHTQVNFALEVVYQVCAALTEPHRQGIIHRDIKPENLILVPSSDETVQVKVLDFGVARVLKKRKMKVTETHIPFVGTPHYMAPEQVASSQYDVRTDLYAIGVMLYELLSGHYPFDDENVLALLLRKTQFEPPPLRERILGEFPYPDVLELVDNLLARDVDQRPRDALEVRRRIEDIRDTYRLPRVRLDVSRMFDRQSEGEHEVYEEAYLEPMRDVFRPWLKLPSGVTLNVALSPQLPADYDEESDIPTNVADVPVPEVVDMTSEALLPSDSAAHAPVRHKLQTWMVDQEWTSSFHVDGLKRDVKEMDALFVSDDPDADGPEELEEAVTSLWRVEDLGIDPDAFGFADTALVSGDDVKSMSLPPEDEDEDAIFTSAPALNRAPAERTLSDGLQVDGLLEEMSESGELDAAFGLSPKPDFSGFEVKPEPADDPSMRATEQEFSPFGMLQAMGAFAKPKRDLQAGLGVHSEEMIAATQENLAVAQTQEELESPLAASSPSTSQLIHTGGLAPRSSPTPDFGAEPVPESLRDTLEEDSVDPAMALGEEAQLGVAPDPRRVSTRFTTSDSGLLSSLQPDEYMDDDTFDSSSPAPANLRALRAQAQASGSMQALTPSQPQAGERTPARELVSSQAGTPALRSDPSGIIGRPDAASLQPAAQAPASAPSRKGLMIGGAIVVALLLIAALSQLL